MKVLGFIEKKSLIDSYLGNQPLSDYVNNDAMNPNQQRVNNETLSISYLQKAAVVCSVPMYYYSDEAH